MANEFVAKNGLISQNNTTISGSLTVSASSGIPLQIKGGTGTLLSVSSSTSEIFKISDTFSPNLFTVSTGSITVFNIDNNKTVSISGSLVVTGSITGSLLGTASFATLAQTSNTASYVVTAQTASYVSGAVHNSNNPALSASYAQTASYVLQAVSASFATLAASATTAFTASSVSRLNQDVVISGSLTVRPSSGRVSLVTDDYAAASAGSILNSQLGSTTGNTYGLIENRTGGSIGNGNLSLQGSGGNVAINKTTFNAVLDVNGNTIITGSLRVTAGITGSLEGTSSFATTASFALNAGGGSGGISQGKVVAIAIGYSNLF
jgi:hypothetical protein